MPLFAFGQFSSARKLLLSQPNEVLFQAVITNGIWIVPSNVTTVIAELYGAGGAGGCEIEDGHGGIQYGGGGAGGNYIYGEWSVVTGDAFTYNIGDGGVYNSSGNGGAGGTVSFTHNGTGDHVTIYGGGGGKSWADGSTGGSAGAISYTSGIMGCNYSGGSGATGTSTYGGGGGGCASSSYDGNNGSGRIGGAAGDGYSGAGGNGEPSGSSGQYYGGGAGGSVAVSGTQGMIKITYY